MANRRQTYNRDVLFALVLVTAAACASHPAELDRELGMRALPWLPPDLARQVKRYEKEFATGAAAASAWPATYHRPGGRQELERAIVTQCERLVASIRNRAPFAEVVGGLGALAHLTLDLDRPFQGGGPDGAHERAFGVYLSSARTRIPIVFYGQRRSLITSGSGGIRPFLAERRGEIAELGPLVRADLDRLGGPGAWTLLDDRSTSFGAASLVLNHAATDFSNLASWIWYHAGGLVPPITGETGQIFVWNGEPKPRTESELSIVGRSPGEATRSSLGFRQGRP